LTLVCLGGFNSSISASDSKACSSSVSGTSSEAEAASGLESALTMKLGLAMRGLQRREIEVEINGKLREANVEAVEEVEEKHSLFGRD
jgi:hypothetical protein